MLPQLIAAQSGGNRLNYSEALLNLEQAARAWQWVSLVSPTEQSTLDFLDLRQR